MDPAARQMYKELGDRLHEERKVMVAAGTLPDHMAPLIRLAQAQLKWQHENTPDDLYNPTLTAILKKLVAVSEKKA